MATVLQRKFVDDEPCVYFDEESWHDLDRSEVRRNRGGLWQRGGYESYTADDEWETLEGSESQRLEAEYQRLVKAGEVEDIDTFLDRPRWIPVSEELPDDGECVLWFNSSWSSPMLVAKRDGESLDWGGDLCHTLRGFTHWMPLPEPPQVN